MPHLIFSGPAADEVIGLLEADGRAVWRGDGDTALLQCSAGPGGAFFLGLYPRGDGWILKVAFPREARSRPEARETLAAIEAALESRGARIVYTNLPDRPRGKDHNLEVGWREALNGRWGGIFGREARLGVEIGFGSGEFLKSLCERNPGMDFVGIEISRESIARAERKLRGLRNVRLVHWDARPALRYLFKDGSIRRLYLNFPFPWDKRRQQKRRLINREFVHVLQRKLGAGGWIQIVSDSRGYVRSARNELRRAGGFRIAENVCTADVSTRYRRKWELEHRAFSTLRAAKTRRKQDSGIEAVEFAAHGFSLGATIDELRGSFRPAVLAMGREAHVKLIERFSLGDRLLVEVLLLEPELRQEFYLEARPTGTALEVSPHPVSPPLRTERFDAAMAEVRRHLEKGIVESRIPGIYRRLLSAYGPQHWWPYDRSYHETRGSDPREEVLIGAILTQNTAWVNVERAINALKGADALSLDTIRAISEERLERLIRASGYFRAKARKLKAFAEFLRREWGGNLDAARGMEPETLRAQLRSVWGIGPETADSMALYAFDAPVFVVDAYTLRIAHRIGISGRTLGYEECKEMFENALPPDGAVYQECHALLVRHAKEHCTSRDPACGDCPVLDLCAFGPTSMPSLPAVGRT